MRAFENIYDCLRREIREETGFEVARIQGEAGRIYPMHLATLRRYAEERERASRPR